MNFKKFCELESYTWKHKFAFLQIEKKLLGRNTFRGYMHDVDKVVYLYPLAFLLGRDSEWCHMRHVARRRHHTESPCVKTRSDYIEMIIDWECARFTKPNKPLDAYQTMKKFYPDLEQRLLPLFKELGLITR